jgi:hypothetical protein
MLTRTFAIGAVLAVLVVTPALAGETIEEHETIEKRSMKIETIPASPPTTVIEKKTTIEVPPPVREKTVETYDKED